MSRQANEAMPDVSDPRFRVAAEKLGMMELFDSIAAQPTIKADMKHMPLVFQTGIEGMANMLMALIKGDLLKE